MPAHRLGGNTGSIFTYADELDIWMRSRGRELRVQPRESRGPVLLDKLNAHRAPLEDTEGLNCLVHPRSSADRAAELTARGYKSWEALSSSNITEIARIFRNAVDLDLESAEAFAGWAISLVAGAILGTMQSQLAYTAARTAVERALELNPEALEAKCAEAWIRMMLERDWGGARRTFDEVLSFCKSNSRALIGQAMSFIAEGSLANASKLLFEVSQTKPLSGAAPALHCWSKALAGDISGAHQRISQVRAGGFSGPLLDDVEALILIQFEDPREHLERLELLAATSPANLVVWGALGKVYCSIGRADKAQRILDSLKSIQVAETGNPAYPIALVLLGLGEWQEAATWLQQSCREGSLWSLGFVSCPILGTLRNDPRYSTLLTRITYSTRVYPEARQAGDALAGRADSR
jgi:tetratricopeptide (TPR) repeat protein